MFATSPVFIARNFYILNLLIMIYAKIDFCEFQELYEIVFFGYYKKCNDLKKKIKEEYNEELYEDINLWTHVLAREGFTPVSETFFYKQS